VPEPVAWYIDGPIVAFGLGGYYETVMCGSCKRPSTRQSADLRVELLAPGHRVWPVDNNGILIDRQTATFLELQRYGVSLRPVSSSWRDGSMAPVPSLMQIVAPCAVRASGVRWSRCSCRAVEEVPFKPLLLEPLDSVPPVGYVAESPSVVLWSLPVRAALGVACPQLEWAPAYDAGSFVPPTHAFDGSDWSDLSG